MTHARTFAAGLLLLSPGLALAVPISTHLDGYYVPYSDIDTEAGEVDDGDGYGIKGEFQFIDQAYFTAEYQANTYDDIANVDGDAVDLDLDFIRAGVGYVPFEWPLYGRVEYIHVEGELNDLPADLTADDVDEDGYGVHIGSSGYLLPQLAGYVEVGYVDIGDFGDGLQATGGISYDFSPMVGVFVEYRYMDLSADQLDPEIGEARAGVRFNFGV
ncbi:hypothetical protein RM530_00005 [Algiphilus sp. W345]|uniref:Outer membrane protein beta-barrel domain-containing protein n=1 Tax=Banduia mediterranea TaxID=3075609 RepID=A0ABU2WEM3_9GAMM|nr:hypothetical protein [Algiphilus sp. W345]MDT0495751.1 hypothetical protein [Algiphilus sp. W345]